MMKFRAWDKVNKKWVHDFRIHPQGMVFPATAVLDEDGSGFWLYEKGNGVELDVDLNLFVGVFDKNDKQIFQGDIVKLTDDNKDVGNFPIEYNNDHASFMVNGFHIDHYTAFVIGMYIEVVGNIYENPELIS